MRWRWKIGLLLISAVEIPVLLWAGVVMEVPREILVYAGGIIAVVLLAILAFRPLLFGLIAAWLAGVVGSAWYFRGYVSSAVALALGAIPATIGGGIVWPFSSRILRFVLRRRV